MAIGFTLVIGAYILYPGEIILGFNSRHGLSVITVNTDITFEDI